MSLRTMIVAVGVVLACASAPGPAMGQLLKKLYKAQLDNGFETKTQGLQKARRLVERKAP